MKNKIEIFQKPEAPPTSYKEKYERLKEPLNNIHQYLETSYSTSPKTLLINASEFDSKLEKNEINYKQAYFNLLYTCYEKAKNNALCVCLKLDPEQIAKLGENILANDIILRKELPKEVKKEEEGVSILTPEGLYQYAPLYSEPGPDKKKQENVLFKSILTKDELIQIGFQGYLTKAEKVNSESHASVKKELIENQLIYDLDEVIDKKHPSSLYDKHFGRNAHKFHTGFLVATSDQAKNQMREKAEASKPKRDNIASVVGDEFVSLLVSELK
jgi:hypothetical protein